MKVRTLCLPRGSSLLLSRYCEANYDVHVPGNQYCGGRHGGG